MIRDTSPVDTNISAINLALTPSVFIQNKIQELEYYVRSYFTIQHGSVGAFNNATNEILFSLEKVMALYGSELTYSRSLVFIDEFFDTGITAFKNSCYDKNRSVFKNRLGWVGKKEYNYSNHADETFIDFFCGILPDLAKEIGNAYLKFHDNNNELSGAVFELNNDMYKIIGAAIVSYHASRHEALIYETTNFLNQDTESNLTKLSSELKANAKVEINDFLNILIKKKSDEISLIKTDYKKFNELYEKELASIMEKTNKSDLLSTEIMTKADSLLESAKDIHGKTNRKAMAGTFEKISRELILPLCLWSFGLVISLVAIFSIGIHFYLYGTAELTVTQMLSRAFLITPMVWLAWFSGRQYNHTSKLRQDYRYKSAVAMAYHGYKAETGEENDKMHTHLLQNIVAHFSDNPVRLYDKVESSMPVEEFLKKISPEHVVDIWKTAIQSKDEKDLKIK
ncbi:hypothetical protein ACWIJ6_07860 [Aeromonas piscicola]